MVNIREYRPEDLRKKSLVEWYDQMLRLKPNDTGLLYARGAALAKAGEHEDAIRSFERICELDSNHLKGWEARAKALYGVGRYFEALKCYDRLLELDPKDEMFWFGKGETLFKLERYKEAVDCYTYAIEINNNFTDAWVGKGNALKAMKSPKKPKPKKKKPEEKEYKQVAEKMESLEDAMKCFMEALRRDPKHAKALEGKGLILCEQGEYEEGLHNLDRATKVNPKCVNALYSKGKVLTKIGKEKEAKKTFAQIMEAPFSYNEPSDPDCWIAKGKASFELERFSDSLLYHERALTINSQDPRAWNGKGDALAKLGRYSESLKCYEKAIKVKPKSEQAWFGKANALRYSGKTDEAFESYDKVIGINPRHVNAWYDKGTLFYVLKQFSEALNCFVQVLKINPHHEKAREKKKETEKMIKIEKEKEQTPKKPEEVLLQKAQKAFQHGKYELALLCYDKILKLDDKNYKAWNGKANTLSKLGRFTESIFCMETAVKLKHDGSKQDEMGKEITIKATRSENLDLESVLPEREISLPLQTRETGKEKAGESGKLRNMFSALKRMFLSRIDEPEEVKPTESSELDATTSANKGELPLQAKEKVEKDAEPKESDLKITISAIRNALVSNTKMIEEQKRIRSSKSQTGHVSPKGFTLPQSEYAIKKVRIFDPEILDSLDFIDKKIVMAFSKGIKTVPEISKELGLKIVIGYAKVLRLEDMGVIECVGKTVVEETSKVIKLYKCSDEACSYLKQTGIKSKTMTE